MNDFSEFAGRLLAVMVSKGILTKSDADFVLDEISADEWAESLQNETSE